MADVRTAAFRRIRELTTAEDALDRDPVMLLEEIDEVAATYASSAESVEEKGRRLLVEGRLTLITVVRDAPAPIYAECRGDSGEVYRLGYDRANAEWRCTCPARGDKCAHLIALRLVSVKPS